ncbi:tRNA lysidine(34) synthetase TilS [Aliidiomarina halalkaliphila]|uniref:tRNA(Ile)-lysidine synthase n=1 Tax=Aliidiomarina halalkaliphila TaxID=2593535 RepID=A0A552X4Z0_9GAMM|nr:tRNA lysidine(34) synthetase TilS [Aliidiomarina halalkaliphila]TRW50019.1 tRNA lysidine(34) synthetase TilS [Aliidiomarina halalkaliphila]
MATVKPESTQRESEVPEDLYPTFVTMLDSLALQAGQQIVVALGGGADSQSVLDLTLRYRQAHPEFRYLAIHLDHFFHPDSPQWAAFLREHCEQVGIDAIVEPLTVPSGPRQSKEEQGRNARYRRLGELTEPNAVILLGQHRTDQVETFFLQMKRGSGPKGLAAMAPVAAMRNTQPESASKTIRNERRLVRPLLDVTKAQIYAYARSRQVPWIEDDTNTDTDIDRNFIRHEVLPVLEQRWPAIQHTVARSASLCAEQTALLERLLSDQLRVRLEPEGFRLQPDWWDLDEALQRALLRSWFAHKALTMPSQAVLHELQTQIQRSSGGKQVKITWSGVTVYRQRKWLKVKLDRNNKAL